MDHEELLHQLGLFAGDDPDADERWRALCEGTLSEEERVKLDELAARSLAARRAREAYDPLDDAARQRITDAIVAQLGGAPADSAPPESLTQRAGERTSGIRFRDLERQGGELVEDADLAASRRGQEQRTVTAEADSLSGTAAPVPDDAAACADATEPCAAGAVEPCPAVEVGDAAAAIAASDAEAPLSPRKRAALAGGRQRGLAARARTFAVAAAWVACAALVSLLALRPAPFAPGAAPVPAYSMTIAASHRGGEANLRIARGTRVALIVSPEAPTRAPIAIRTFVRRAGDVRAWAVPLIIDTDGSARLNSTREALFAGLPAGAWDVVIAVGDPASLPDDPGELARALRKGAGDGADGYRLLRRGVILD